MASSVSVAVEGKNNPQTSDTCVCCSPSPEPKVSEKKKIAEKIKEKEKLQKKKQEELKKRVTPNFFWVT